MPGAYILYPTRLTQRLNPNRFASRQLREEILARDGYRCRYCGCPVTIKTVHIDHIKPWSFGGHTKERNLVASCRECNKIKGARVNIHQVPSQGQANDLLGKRHYGSSSREVYRMDKEFTQMFT